MDASAATNASASSSTFASVLASAGGPSWGPRLDFARDVFFSTSAWTVILTVIAMCVVYDQSTSIHPQALP